MKRLILAIVPLLFALAALGARAELTIEITQGMDNPTAIAVVPFAWQGPGTAPEDIAWVVDSDLARSGQFRPCPVLTCWADPAPRMIFSTAIGVPLSLSIC